MKYVIFLVLPILTLGACNTTKTNQPKDEFHGKWTLTSYAAFRPSIPDINEGDIVWDFESNKKSVVITKKKEAHSFVGPKPGTYTYAVKQGTITINGSDYFYKFSEGKMILDNNTDPRLSKDLPVIGFKRM